MKAIRFSAHAEVQMLARDISRELVEATVREPGHRVWGRAPREVLSRLMEDGKGGKKMLLRVFVEENESEIAVVTVYKTSKLWKYLPEELP